MIKTTQRSWVMAGMLIAAASVLVWRSCKPGKRQRVLARRG